MLRYLGEILKTDIRDLGGVGRERVPFGFIAYNKESNAVYIVFRGTMTPAEWITNAQFKPGCESFLGENDLGKVHRGFHKIYTRKDIGSNLVKEEDDIPSIRECIENAIKGCPKHTIGLWPTEAIEKCSPDAQVYITGHSLGGALATLATLHIKEMKYFQKAPILYAFANPRVGDLKFSKRFDDLDCFRIANSEDIVPTVPLASIDLTSGSNDKTSESLKESLKKQKELSLLFSAVLPDLDYHHIGEPIYFTNHKGAIADNHIIPAYKEALGII
ncbi:putative lipase [Microcystis aeruginosa PCC 9807]|uniref:Putative lipase n=1 Tax=Microcystis aeruginosa PCC 9807 TaxID=1160283 RepID=I4H4L9_MICAE|nr:lipase family protein [Microcystis aeruginosa]CCI16993.1 putative lipase [Microcystis aeruginosa PCC 9807]